jgi:acetamidase/formamidase
MDEHKLDEHKQRDVIENPVRRAFLRAGAALGISGAALPGCASLPQSAPSGLSGEPLPRFPARRTHTVESNRDTVRIGAMDPALPPIVTIDSGDIVHYPNTWVNWANEAKYGMSFEEREPIRKKYPDGPYSLIGPVAVRGAEPGDLVECRMLKLRPIDWGWTSSPSGVGALPRDFKPYLRYVRFDAERRYGEFAPGIRIPLAPTQGIIATMPAEDGRLSGILSGPFGGNVKLRDLVEGTSLFLPVFRSGAMIWTGNSKGSQGDGVVNQTGLETAMEDLRIQYILHKRSPLKVLMAETPQAWIGVGNGENLDLALQDCLRGMIAWLAAASGIQPADAYALYSVAGSFRVTRFAQQIQTVYTTKPAQGVHGVLSKAVFTPEMSERISRYVRTGS